MVESKDSGFLLLFLLLNKDLFRIFLLSKLIFYTLPGKSLILGNHGRSYFPPRYDLSPVFQVVDMVSYQFHVTTVLPSCHVCLYLTSLNQNLKCYFLTRTQHDWGSDSVKFEFSMKFYHKKLVSELIFDTRKPPESSFKVFVHIVWSVHNLTGTSARSVYGWVCVPRSANLTFRSCPNQKCSLWQNKILVSKKFFKSRVEAPHSHMCSP